MLPSRAPERHHHSIPGPCLQAYIDSLKEPFCLAERAILFVVGFEFGIGDPYPHVGKQLRALGVRDDGDRSAKIDIQQMAWNFLRDRWANAFAVLSVLVACGWLGTCPRRPQASCWGSWAGAGGRGLGCSTYRGGLAGAGPSTARLRSPAAHPPTPLRSLNTTLSLRYPPEKIAATAVFLALQVGRMLGAYRRQTFVLHTLCLRCLEQAPWRPVSGE